MHKTGDQLKIEIAKAQLQGNTLEQISVLLNLSESYIKEVTSALDFPSLLEQLQENSALSRQEAYERIDHGYQSTEERMLGILEDTETFQYMMGKLIQTPRDFFNALKTVNATTRRSTGENPLQNQSVDSTVTLVLPAFIIDKCNEASLENAKVVHNKNNEIIEVNGETLEVMPSKQLDALLPIPEDNHEQLIEKSLEKVTSLVDWD